MNNEYNLDDLLKELNSAAAAGGVGGFFEEVSFIFERISNTHPEGEIGARVLALLANRIADDFNYRACSLARAIKEEEEALHEKEPE